MDERDSHRDQQRRLLLTIVVTTVVMFLWWQFVSPKQAPQAPIPPNSGTAGAPRTVSDAGAQVAAAAPDAGADAGPAAAEAPPALPEKRLTITTPSQELVFTSKGGGLASAIVKNGGVYPERKFRSREKTESGEAAPVNVVRIREGQAAPGSIEVKGELALPLTADYQAERTEDGVSFRAATGQVAVEKRYRVNENGWETRLEVRVTNLSGAPKKASLAVVYPGSVDPATQKGGSLLNPRPENVEATCRHGGDTERFGAPGGAGGCGCGGGTPAAKRQTFAGPVHFVAFDESYFMGAIFPRFAEGTSCTLYEDPSGVREATLEIDLGTLAAGQTATRELGLYLGPKLFDELKRVSEENVLGAPLTALGQSPKPASAVSAGFDPELSSAIDFRVWLFFFRPDFAVICRVLLWIMRLFHDLFVNWGIAIILLTVVVKALLYPLSHKQMESMEAMRRLQPQLQALEKKYKEDKEKLNLEKMKLFQENKVNPFGGCLPLLIQMPVWVALYSTLLASFELYREPLIGFWIKDLTLHDPYYVLPIAMGLTMFITQKMQPQMGDAAQAKMMLYFMPILFTFFMLSLPAGLTLYIFTNNLLSIAQQKVLQHRFAKKAAR